MTQERRARVSAGEIAFVEAGDAEAPAVVLLAGGLRSSHLWRNLVPLLAPWMRVLAVDLLGSGSSESPTGADLGLEAHAGYVRELLERLGIDRFAVAGHGHGGGVAQLLALGGGAEALVLMDSIAFDAWPGPSIRELRARSGGFDRATVDAWLIGAMDIGMSRRERLSEEDVEGYLRPFAGPDGVERFERVVASLDGRGLVGLEPRLASLEIPALVLWGEEDRFLPVELAERLGDALPMATIALLPGCGHLPLDDAPETVAPLVFQYLRSRYLGTPHTHDAGTVTVQLGRPPQEDRW
ncbi:MAG TPA: alpha/beta fold hydrolase [Actinomycetota bacterium]|nr:alpha/beta fold hydrolase [Actinomycetota bacterium]